MSGISHVCLTINELPEHTYTNAGHSHKMASVNGFIDNFFV